MVSRIRPFFMIREMASAKPMMKAIKPMLPTPPAKVLPISSLFMP